MNDYYVIVDKVKWWVNNNGTSVHPICPIHNLGLHRIGPADLTYKLECAECKDIYEFERTVSSEFKYVIDKVGATIFKELKFINLDDVAIPIAENNIKSNSPFFITSVLTKSKSGLRLIIYAGEKGSTKKTQIFVEPEIKRLAFDQKDLHPNDVFTKLEATFKNGSKHKMIK